MTKKKVLRRTLAMVVAERDAAETMLRALRQRVEIPEGAWTRYLNNLVALESESDSEDAYNEAAALRERLDAAP